MKRIALIVALVALMAPAAAGAKIVVNHGMFGVGLGATEKQVRGKLGAPTNVQKTAASATWFYIQRQLVVSFTGSPRRATSLFTSNPNQRTGNGIGVGSTKKQVKRLIGGVHCTNTPGAGVSCIVSSGANATNFHIGAHNLVNNILISVVG